MTLGYHYQEGIGTTVDQVRAVALFQKACDQGNAVGCDHLANHYLTGAGLSTGSNLPMAQLTYQKSCTLGDSSSCTELKDPKLQPAPVIAAKPTSSVSADALNKQGEDYFSRKDYKHAAPLYQQACDAGQSFACTSLGYLYAQGDGVSKNLVTAVAYYRKGCVAGDMMGCADLGNHVRDGDAGSPADPHMASIFFLEACNGGNDLACRSLAILSDNGSPLGVDLAKAKVYYQKACTLKDQVSCDTLKGTRFN